MSDDDLVRRIYESNRRIEQPPTVIPLHAAFSNSPPILKAEMRKMYLFHIAKKRREATAYATKVKNSYQAMHSKWETEAKLNTSPIPMPPVNYVTSTVIRTSPSSAFTSSRRSLDPIFRNISSLSLDRSVVNPKQHVKSIFDSSQTALIPNLTMRYPTLATHGKRLVFYDNSGFSINPKLDHLLYLCSLPHWNDREKKLFWESNVPIKKRFELVSKILPSGRAVMLDGTISHKKIMMLFDSFDFRTKGRREAVAFYYLEKQQRRLDGTSNKKKSLRKSAPSGLALNKDPSSQHGVRKLSEDLKNSKSPPNSTLKNLFRSKLYQNMDIGMVSKSHV